MKITDLPIRERNNSPELNSSQSIHNNGIPPMVVYIISAFVLLLFFVMFSSQREVGQLAAEVQTLQLRVVELNKSINVAEIRRSDRLEDQLRQDNIKLAAKLEGKNP